MELKETNHTIKQPHENSKLFLSKNPSDNESKKMISIIIVLVIMKIIIITIIIKCKGRSRTPTATNTEIPVTLYNGRKPSTNITKCYTSDVAWVL